MERINDLPSGQRPGLSIIIPALNEGENIAAALNRIPKTPTIEVIVADGGSVDGTKAVAASWGARVISSPPGRAWQMNHAAGEAGGAILLFLHADTRLPEGFADHIYRLLSRPEISAGAFQLKFDPPIPGLGIIERLANWRARAWQLPYGDQAVFLRAERFWAMGGFSEIPIMEDVDLIRRLARLGPVVIAPVPVMTSSRRWKNSGVLKTTLKNQILLAAYFAGISPHHLARWYYGKGKK
jgi:rSAM/selenodomain-associated transferase 2